MRAGAPRVHVQVTPGPAAASGHAAEASGEVDVAIVVYGADQTALDRALAQTAPVCAGESAGREVNQDCSRRLAAEADRPTVIAPLDARHDRTVSAPLSPRFDQTVLAPLSVAPASTREPAAGQMAETPTVNSLLAPAEPAPASPAAAPPPSAADEGPSEADVPPSGAEVPPSADEVASRPAPTPATTGRLRRRAVEFVQLAAVLLGIVLGIRTLIQTFRVDGVSMLPTFVTGQMLIVNRTAYWHTDGTPFEGLLPVQAQGSVKYVFGGPRRGDVVVFRPPGDSNFEADLIKRIIGLPGDTVSIKSGEVSVNGYPLTEPYIRFPADYTYPGDDLAVLVPADSYFVLGDNRPESADSHLGWLVPAEKLIGQAWLSYWPPDRWGLVSHADLTGVPSRPARDDP